MRADVNAHGYNSQAVDWKWRTTQWRTKLTTVKIMPWITRAISRIVLYAYRPTQSGINDQRYTSSSSTINHMYRYIFIDKQRRRVINIHDVGLHITYSNQPWEKMLAKV